MTTPVLFLTSGAIFAGAMINWFILPTLTEPVLPIYFKILPAFVTITGALIAWLMITKSSTTQSTLINVITTHEASSTIWFITPISSNETIRLVHPCHDLLKTVDHGWIEIARAQGIFSLSSSLSSRIQLIQANSITIFLTVSTLIIIPTFLLL
jgi:hypothetical protein